MTIHSNLIVEGIDRIGKTKLIEALEGYNKQKLTPPVSFTSSIYTYMSYFQTLSSNRNVPIIFDRGHISEMVYGKLYRPNDFVDGVLLRWFKSMEACLSAVIEENATIFPTTIVYIDPVNLNIMEKDERVNGNVINELAMYEMVLARTKLPVVRIATQTKRGWRNVDDVVIELKELLNV